MRYHMPRSGHQVEESPPHLRESENEREILAVVGDKHRVLRGQPGVREHLASSLEPSPVLSTWNSGRRQVPEHDHQVTQDAKEMARWEEPYVKAQEAEVVSATPEKIPTLPIEPRSFS